MVLVDVVPLRGMYAIVSGDAVTKLGVDEGGCDPSSAMTVRGSLWTLEHLFYFILEAKRVLD